MQARNKSKGGRPSLTEKPDGHGIRALLVGLAVLQKVGLAKGPVPLRDIAAASDLTPSRAHRYLASLVELDFVRQEAGSGHYTLGQAAVEFGLLALGQLDYIDVGTRALRAFSENAGLDAHLAVWSANGPTVVRWQSGRLGYQMKIEEGRVLPLLWSATGRVLMAYREVEEIMPLAQPEIAVWNEEHPDRPISADQIAQVCSAVREREISSLIAPEKDQAEIPLMGAIFPRFHRFALETMSVPIFDRQGGVDMALTCFGAHHISLHDEPENKYVGLLREAGHRASRELGFG